MSINFKDLDIPNYNGNTQILVKWNDKDILVDKFISTDNKYDIVMISLQQAKEDGYYNPLLLDMYFHLNLVYSYTDIIFDEEERLNPSDLYDKLKISGLLNEILKAIDEKEYQEMFDYMEEIKYNNEQYMRSFSSVAQKLIDDLPASVKAALDIVDNFDENKFQAVKDFAKAANGDREI